MKITPPVIQIALDYATIEEAIAMAEIGIRAGVDWLEVGTPLIVSQGVDAIGRLKRAYPDYPVLADYKTMDSGGKNVMLTHQQGGQVMTVCGNAPDETVQAAVAASKQTGVGVGVDLIGGKNPAARGRRGGPGGAAVRAVGRQHDFPPLRRRPAPRRRHARLDPMARRSNVGRLPVVPD